MKSISLWNLAGASLLALSVAQPAVAQSFEEIVVTAQRREQSLQDVPISISTFSGEDMQQLRIDRAQEVSVMTPGMFATGSRGDANPIFTIRGIGLNDFLSNNNPTVGIYIDEVVQPFTPLLGFQMFDLERIEVLKGPQGTLYGRNTTGGAINFISRRPTEELNGYASASYSRFDRFELEGAVGGAVASNLAVRLSAKTTQQSGGWQTNALTGEKVGDIDRNAVRAQVLWTPTDRLDILVKGSLFKDDSDLQLREHVGSYAAPFDPNFTPCAGVATGALNPGQCVDFVGYFDPTPERRTVENSAIFGHQSNADAQDIASTINWHGDDFTITSITSYTNFNRVAGDDTDGSALVQLDSLFSDDIKSFTQELRVTSEDSHPLSWVVGAYYSWDRINGDILQALDDHIFNTRVDTSWSQKTDAYAIFGQVEYDVTEQIRLSAGLRYTEEKKKYRYDAIDLDPFDNSSLPLPVAGINDTLKEDNISGKLGIDFTVNDDLMLYASASKGFKSGGFNGAIAFDRAELMPFTGEDLYAYEVGAKATLWDGKLRLNAAGYYYDWRDFQAFVTQIRSGVNVIVLSNAGDAEVWGAELEAVAMPTDRLTMRAAANYMDTEISKFNAEAGDDFTGNRLANSPELSFSGQVRYDLPVEEWGFGAYLLGDASYRSRVYYSLGNRLQSSQKGYWLLNARLGITSPDERWEFAIWGRNLTNKLYVSQSYDNFGGIFPSQNFLGDPRTYGATLSFNF